MQAKEMLKNMGIKKVIFNGKTTVVYLKDGRKGVAHCGSEDEFDPTVGLSVAYAEAMCKCSSKKELKGIVKFLERKKKFEVEYQGRRSSELIFNPSKSCSMTFLCNDDLSEIELITN